MRLIKRSTRTNGSSNNRVRSNNRVEKREPTYNITSYKYDKRKKSNNKKYYGTMKLTLLYLFILYILIIFLLADDLSLYVTRSKEVREENRELAETIARVSSHFWTNKKKILLSSKHIWSFELWSFYRRLLDFHNNPVPGTKDGDIYYTPSRDVFLEAFGLSLDSSIPSREDRFPSVEERIRYYMGDFYEPKQRNLVGDKFRRHVNEDWINTLKIPIQQNNMIDSVMVNPFGNDPLMLIQCSEFLRAPTVSTTPGKNEGEYIYNIHSLLEDYQKMKDEKLSEPRSLKANYCRDSIDLFLLHKELNVSAPLLIHFKDFIPMMKNPELDKDLPLFNKVRDLTDGTVNREGAIPDGTPYNVIIWPFNRRRHLTPLSHVIQKDIPFEEKIGGVLFWRGDYNVHDPTKIKAPVEISGPLQRWRLVMDHSSSPLVDAKYFSPQISNSGTIPRDKIESKAMPMEEILKYKYLVSLEGHDMATSLKWMLFSNSCVFSPTFTWDSWAMENMLEPFVHYVPIHANMSNVEEMVQWAESNPKKVKEIAYRGKIFMYDMLFHEDAMKDEEDILRGIIKKYDENYSWRNKYDNACVAFEAAQHATHSTDDVASSRSFFSLSSSKGNKIASERKDRFPSVAERLEYYMGFWFNKESPCMQREHSNKIYEDYYPPNKQLDWGMESIVDSTILKNCVSAKRNDKLEQFCIDAASDFSSTSQDEPFKIIRFAYTAGDKYDVPVFSKYRRIEESELTEIPEKETMIRTKRLKGSSWKENTDEKILLWQFEYDHDHAILFSDLIARFDTHFLSKVPRLGHHTGENEESRIRDLLSYRYLISLENDEIHFSKKNSDHHRDLKWMLLSNSVVFMPQPKYVSWFMEDFGLQPFVHYVPIKSDLLDVDAKILWCEKNLKICERISQRATLYMYDFYFHPDADEDNMRVKWAMMEKYKNQFNCN